MSKDTSLIVGEFARTIDDRFRLTLPPEMAARLAPLRLFAVKEEDGWIWVGEHRANA